MRKNPICQVSGEHPEDTVTRRSSKMSSTRTVLLALATAVTRLAALVVSRRERPAPPVHPDALVLADRLPPPIVSLLIPLYREAEVLGRLLEGLHDIDYPRDRLDVKLLIEEDDGQTTEALARHAEPIGASSAQLIEQ